eukprot:CFRG7884T1
MADPQLQKQYDEFIKLPSTTESINRVAQPHGDIQTVIDDILFYVSGRFTVPIVPWVGSLMYLQRGMTIVKGHDGALTLINSCRLTEEGLIQLEKLGEVKHLVRLSTFHGGDDAFYLSRYPSASYYIMAGMVISEGVKQTPIALTDDSSPIPGAKVLKCPGTEVLEGLLVLPIGPGVLVTCDVLQNQCRKWSPHTSILMSTFMYFNGFFGQGNVGPGFAQFAYKIWGLNAKEALPPMLKQLIGMEWDVFVSAHGEPLHNAKAVVRDTLERQFYLRED